MKRGEEPISGSEVVGGEGRGGDSGEGGRLRAISD